MAEELREFVDGEEYEHVFDTPLGPVVLAVTVSISGSVLTLGNILVEPIHTRELQIGVPVLLRLRRSVLEAAKWQGYTEVVVDGKRTSGRNPNRPVHLRGVV